jgi:uncharacterized protein (DUF1501 family)
MGRAPLGNADSGKDHWPVTSALVLGGGVAGGRAYGGTDDQCIDQPVDLATGRVDPAGVRLYTANVLAGVLELVGVDSSQYLPGVEPLRGFAA